MSQVEAANIGAVVSKLGSIGMVLLALHKLAISHDNCVDSDTLATDVESMTK